MAIITKLAWNLAKGFAANAARGALQAGVKAGRDVAARKGARAGIEAGVKAFAKKAAPPEKIAQVTPKHEAVHVGDERKAERHENDSSPDQAGEVGEHGQ